MRTRMSSDQDAIVHARDESGPGAEPRGRVRRACVRSVAAGDESPRIATKSVLARRARVGASKKIDMATSCFSLGDSAGQPMRLALYTAQQQAAV